MNLVLTGFMGTGKSVVGRRVAERLRVPFFDVDQTIRKTAGMSVSEIFDQKGEAAFRELESATLAELAQKDRIVIAAGGGALINPANRRLLEGRTILVCLTARTGTLLERLKNDLTRPLLQGEDLGQRIDRLMKDREAVYAACPIQIATDGRTIEEVAEDILGQIRSRWEAGPS